MMKFNIYTKVTMILVLFFTFSAHADVGSDVSKLQRRWAEINYQMKDDAQVKAFEKLVADAGEVTARYPDSAAAWIWSGIIKSSFAGARGGLGALGIAKDSKKDLEHALQIDPAAMDGSAYTSLGTLYFNVPGWPIGFGNDKKAEAMLKKALSLNPTGIDPNYFYASYLVSEHRYQDAEKYFTKAQQAPGRPDRPLADSGRQKEIALALSDVRKRLAQEKAQDW